MPGTARSGRRKLPKPEGLDLPEITDEESALSLLAKVTRYVGTGELDPRYADSMTAAAKAYLAGMQRRYAREAEARLVALLKEAKRVAGGAAGNDDDGSEPADGATPRD